MWFFSLYFLLSLVHKNGRDEWQVSGRMDERCTRMSVTSSQNVEDRARGTSPSHSPFPGSSITEGGTLSSLQTSVSTERKHHSNTCAPDRRQRERRGIHCTGVTTRWQACILGHKTQYYLDFSRELGKSLKNRHPDVTSLQNVTFTGKNIIYMTVFIRLQM